MEKILAWFFFGLAFCLLALAGYCYFAPEPGSALEVAATDIEVAGATAGRKQDVVLSLYNHSRQGIRILGLTTC